VASATSSPPAAAANWRANPIARSQRVPPSGVPASIDQDESTTISTRPREPPATTGPGRVTASARAMATKIVAASETALRMRSQSVSSRF
jgi:hypothetical protein